TPCLLTRQTARLTDGAVRSCQRTLRMERIAERHFQNHSAWLTKVAVHANYSQLVDCVKISPVGATSGQLILCAKCKDSRLAKRPAKLPRLPPASLALQMN